MENSQLAVTFEEILQLIELADRLVKLNYTSRTEANFVNNLSQRLVMAMQQQKQEQNNKVDENTPKE